MWSTSTNYSNTCPNVHNPKDSSTDCCVQHIIIDDSYEYDEEEIIIKCWELDAEQNKQKGWVKRHNDEFKIRRDRMKFLRRKSDFKKIKRVNTLYRK